MAMEANCLSFRRALNPFSSRVSFQNVGPPRVRFFPLAAVKRSPKRLKYSAPRFSKDGELLYVEVDPSGADSWKLDPIVKLLKEGAVGVIPTDTLYAITCDMRRHSAIERLRRIKNIEPSKARTLVLFVLSFDVHTESGMSLNHLVCRTWLNGGCHEPLSILCRSFRDIDTYTMGFPRGNGQGVTNIFRAVKHCLPGPYTFILIASKELPKRCTAYGTTTAKFVHQRNVGVRIPDDAVCQAILEKMDAPLISTSVKSPEENRWIIDPVVIADVYGPEGLDFVVDAGVRLADLSTVVDMTGSSPRILRQGKGPKQPWMAGEDDGEAYPEKQELIPYFA